MANSNNKRFNRIVAEPKSEEIVEVKQIIKFLLQWLFFAAVALIPSIISFLISVQEEDTYLTFFANYQILYVSFTLALALFIKQIQEKTGFESKHYLYLFIIFIGFAFYLLLDNGIKFNFFSDTKTFAQMNLVYLILILSFGFYSYLKRIFVSFLSRRN
ncbi:MAG: hypothetical protein FWC15_04035 [Fibromonadales bacterium]|nr:hypothetical protein [Fibromonadales bacterium]